MEWAKGNLLTLTWTPKDLWDPLLESEVLK